MMKTRTKSDYRKRRHQRLRRKVRGTPERPRLCVCVTGRHIYAQVIDDTTGSTLASASTCEKAMADARVTAEIAGRIGQTAAQRAREKGIEAVVFDTGGFRYGKRLQALADAARKEGLRF